MAKKDNVIKKIRKNAGLTQNEFCIATGIPKTTLCNWEQGLREPNEWTIDLIIDKIFDHINSKDSIYSEAKGIYSFSSLKAKIKDFCIDKDIDEVYLFGDYAIGKANQTSSVRLLVKSNLTGMKFYGLSAQLKKEIHKKIEIVDKNKLILNSKKDREIRKTSLLVYHRGK